MKRLIRNERGQALLHTLLLLLVGLLILTPVLNYMGTGISSGRVYEQKVAEIYAADSGVEDALWHIRNDTLNATLSSRGYDEYNYSSNYSYPEDYDLVVNGKDVVVTIQNIWIPKGIATPSPSVARQIIEGEKLLIVGYPSSTANTYTIKIVFDWASTTERDNLRVKTIGIWVSPGFEYVANSCDLTGYSEQISLYKGGTAVVWTFAAQPTLKSFPAGTNGPPMVRTFTFQYTGPEGQIPELVSSWVDTTGVTGVTYSWDPSIRLYKIVSQAGGIQVEAYGAKTKFRRLKSTISSDYTVAGNSLMEHTRSGGGSCYLERYRDRLYAERDSTVLRQALEEVIENGSADPGKIPAEAIITNVYLYWSGWIDPYYYYWKSSWPSGWQWAQITDLRYSQKTKAQLIANSKVNMVKFGVDGSAQTVTAGKYQIISTSDSGSDSWTYSCFKDVTNLVVSENVTVKEYIENAMRSSGSGTVTFAVGHADEVRGVRRTGTGNDTYYFNLYNTGQSTGYPLATPAHMRPDETCYQTRYQWSYAGWSLIIFYSSPALLQRQLYLYDEFRYVNVGTTMDFTISGFLAPPPVSEDDKSHLTYHVGDGDPHYTDSYIGVNYGEGGGWMSDPPTNPQNNALNSNSTALYDLLVTDGLDADTYVVPTDYIDPYDVSAKITLKTTQEIYTLVYLILSFRSELTTGGIITNYSIRIL